MSTSVLVQPVNSPDDFAAVYHCIREAFVRQIRDSIWISMNPEWGPPEGQKEGASKLLRRWQSVTKNKEGQPNTIILKASVPNPQDETKHKIMGAAIWSQTSFVDGHGDRPTDSPADVAALSDTEKRFASQMYRSLWKRRVALAREKACSDSPAMFTLYTWAVDPAFQRRGVAGKLVEWGLQEAKRRGGLECTTEASRHVWGELCIQSSGSERRVQRKILCMKSMNSLGIVISRRFCSCVLG